MLQTVESDIRDQRIRDLEKQCHNNECLIHLLQDSNNLSLEQINEMEIRLNEEQSNVLCHLAEIVILKDELANMKILEKQYSIILGRIISKIIKTSVTLK